MEGQSIIESSYKNLQKFKDVVTSDNFQKVSILNINLKNYDMETQSGLKSAVRVIYEIYQDELNMSKLDIQKMLTGEVLTIKIPSDIEGFKDDLSDSLKTYIEKQSPKLFSIITSSNSSGGIYSV